MAMWSVIGSLKYFSTTDYLHDKAIIPLYVAMYKVCPMR